MVPSGTPGSFIAAMRQCRSDRQRQHISAAYPWNTLPWQHIDAMRPRAAGRGNISTPCVPEGAGRGNISPWCVFGRSPMAKCSRNAFPSVRQWQDIAAVRFRGGPVVARYRRDAFPGGDPWQLFRFMRSRRGLGREKRPFLAAYRRRASETSRLRQDIRVMHPKSAASSRPRIHRAKILPRRGPFRCTGPSDHARRAGLAVVRRLNEKRSGKAKKLPAFRQEHVQK